MKSKINNTLCSVSDAVMNEGRNPKVWREHCILGMQAYLLLMHQGECDTSYYAINSIGEKTPLFETAWLSSKLTAAENDNFIHTAAELWKRRVQWAGKRNYALIARTTICEFVHLNCSKDDYTARERARYLTIGLGATAQKYWQHHFTESGELVAKIEEYPGWILDTLAA